MSKKLETTQIESQLKRSAFFRKPDEETEEKNVEKKDTEEEQSIPDVDTMVPTDDDTVVPRYHDTMIPRHRGIMAPDTLEAIRKAVKQLGDKAATHRFTLQEKEELNDIEFAYRKNYRYRTSENEITRIGVNWIIHDYKENGEQSILHKVLKALNE